MCRLRSLGCDMRIGMYGVISRCWRALSMPLCVRVTQCTVRGERQRDYATSTVDSQRSAAKQGKEACMRRSERAVRTPWRQERRQRNAKERRHLSSAMRHRWGRALTRVLTCVGVRVRPCGASTPGGCTGRRRDQGARPTEILHFSSAVGHWALVRCAGLAMAMALGGRRGSRGCQGRTRLRKWLPFYVLSLPRGP